MMAQGADASLVSYRSAAHAATTMLRDEGFGPRSTRGSASRSYLRRSRAASTTGIEMSHSTFGQGTSLTDFAAGMSAQLVSSIALRAATLSWSAAPSTGKSEAGRLDGLPP